MNSADISVHDSRLVALTIAQQDLLSSLQYIPSDVEASIAKRELFAAYLHGCIADDRRVVVDEFNGDLEWINVVRPLRLHTDLRGRLVVLDFFTYCCVNCMHILPKLKALDEKFQNNGQVVVIGVHSAKFDNEQNLDNVTHAVLRYDITHPVVNDYMNTMWASLEVCCWPTIVILGPSAEVLFTIIGEHQISLVDTFVESAVEYFGGLGMLRVGAELPIRSLRSSLPPQLLLYPGKIACCHFGDRGMLVIADSGHHRIVIVTASGLIQAVVGGEEAGLADGDFATARFHSPQGVTWLSPSLIFVADTENHVLRKIDLEKRNVTTVAGSGMKGNCKTGGRKGVEQELSSPWDLCPVNLNKEETSEPNMLILAMAGVHQIWGFALDNLVFRNGRALEKETCLSLSGTGREENRNNSYSHLVSYAQPSGVCLASVAGSKRLIVADSESSAIRSVDLTSWAVEGIVGADRDPTDLFAFGDEDGVGIRAKLQHPMGVCYSASRNVIFVADSYNHKIKQVKLDNKKCETLHLNAIFAEPGGVCLSKNEDLLFVADTNNHCIKVVDLRSNIVSVLLVRFTEIVTVSEGDGGATSRVSDVARPMCSGATVEGLTLQGLKLFLRLHVTEALKLNPMAPNNWELRLPSDVQMSADRLSGNITATDVPLELCTLSAPPSVPSEPLDLVLFLNMCDHDRCLMDRVVIRIPVDHTATTLDQLSEHMIDYTVG